MQTKILEGIINENKIKFICVGQKDRMGTIAISSVLRQITDEEWRLPSLSELKELLQKSSDIIANDFYQTSTGEKVCASRIVYHPVIGVEGVYHNPNWGFTLADFEKRHGKRKYTSSYPPLFETILISGKTNLEKDDPFILCNPCLQHSDCHVYNGKRNFHKKKKSQNP